MAASQPRILVAEDNHVLSRVICFNLESQGLLATAARDGREAMDYLGHAVFDLLITDYQLPLVDGAGLCSFVRDELQNEHLPIILCSAKAMELDAAAMQARWNLARVFRKPFSVSELMGVVWECLELASTREGSPLAMGDQEHA